ncbi:PREDICTED: zinc finger MYM-type protein 1-like [Nicotiana attenuata]|uniref:zinc finger MYM-type protein 1-like n=1 Tax=Nicotiana attenuata TaxID=49451 RepID=UPI000904613E|nr:PREDICTED: zinc finger MYM-type protein 1-like [Nicotiana attenuata]
MLDLLNQAQSIITSFDKQSEKAKIEYRVRLNASIDVARSCAKETLKAIIKDLNGDYFGILVDESKDVSHKEQMALVLRYVNKEGKVIERFLSIVHVKDTSAKSLKEAICSLLLEHSLSKSQIRGQGYDGASNMQGEINGLKTLIMNDTPSAHCIHCFAHQLQLTLVAVAKKHYEAEQFFDILANVLNIVGGSFKRREMLRDDQAEKLEELLVLGEVHTGSGLNQELGLQRAGDTRWGSHFKTVRNFISLFSSIVHVLGVLSIEGSNYHERSMAKSLVDDIRSYEFLYILHLMLKVLALTFDLNMALQKKDQDIVSAMKLVDFAKRQLQVMRESGWNSLVEEVSLFCVKHDIVIPEMDMNYYRGKSKRKKSSVTYSYHLRVEVFYTVIDLQLSELNSRFSEVNTDLLLGMASLSPDNSFANYDKDRIMKLATHYPDEFTNSILEDLGFELDIYIDYVREAGNEFSNLKSLGDLSETMVKTNLHMTWRLVYLLVKLSLILPVATATVERAFSSMKYVKSDLRSRIGNEFLNDCLVCYIEDEVFESVPNDMIIDHFQNMTSRRVQL